MNRLKSKAHTDESILIISDYLNRGRSEIITSSPTDYEGLKRNEKSVMIERMMEDDRISLCLESVHRAVRNLDWEIRSDREDVRLYVQRALERVPFREFVGQLLSARIYGFALFEVVWEENEEGIIVISKIVPVPQRAVEFVTDDYGRLSEIKIDGESFPLGWFHLYMYPSPQFGNYYGESILRNIYREWYNKSVLLKYRNLGLENFAFPVIRAVYDSARYQPGTPQWDELMKLIEGIKNDARIAVPGQFSVDGSALVPGVQIELLQPDYSAGGFEALNRAVESENLAISRYLGLSDDVGFAGNAQPLDAKQTALRISLFRQAVHDVVLGVRDNVQELVDRIVRINFGEEADARFEFDLGDDASVEEALRFVSKSAGKCSPVGRTTRL